MHFSYSNLNSFTSMISVERVRVTISVDRKVIEWIDAQVEAGAFFNRSHGFEFCVKKEMRE